MLVAHRVEKRQIEFGEVVKSGLEIAKSAKEAYDAFAEEDEGEDAISAVFINNYLNRTLDVASYRHPTEDVESETLPTNVGPGVQAGFSLEMKSSEPSLQAGATWRIIGGNGSMLISYWGVYKDGTNYLVVAIGSQELANQLSEIKDFSGNDVLDDYCNNLREAWFRGKGKKIKHCDEQFCVVGIMGTSQRAQIVLQLYPAEYQGEMIAANSQDHIPNRKQLVELLNVKEHSDEMRCAGIAGAFRVETTLGFLLIVRVAMMFVD